MNRQKIATLSDLYDAINMLIIFDPFIFSKEDVELFGKLTGDQNDHNSVPTERFPQPVVQGAFSVATFGKFHKEACQFPGSDPISTEIVRARFLSPIYVGNEVIPKLCLVSVDRKLNKDNKKYIGTLWDYKLYYGQEILFSATFKVRYYHVL